MKLSVNLATRPFVNRLPHVLLLASLLVAGVGLTAWNLSLWLGTRSEARAVEAELSVIDAQEHRIASRRSELERRLATVDLGALQVKVDAANQVLAEKALSWTLLLDRLKETMPYDAALKSVRADVGVGSAHLYLEVRSRNEEYYLQLLESLEQSSCFTNVYPTNDISGDQGEVEASISAEYDAQCGEGPPPQTKKSKRPGGAGKSRARKGVSRG